MQVAVRRQGIDARQFQELLDALFAQETLECAEPHFGCLNMTQVIVHQVTDSLPRCAAALEPFENFLSHFRALFCVAVKSDALGILADANRLRHVMQQTAVGQCF